MKYHTHNTDGSPDLKLGDLIILKNMWKDNGDLEPLLQVTAVSKARTRPYIHVIIMSGRDLGQEHVVDTNRHVIKVVSC